MSSNIAEGELTSIAFCWQVERTDGGGVALTSSDRDLVRDGVRYEAAPGVTPAAVRRSLGLEPDAGEVAGALSSGALSRTDLGLGRWNGARLSLVAVDWNDEAAQPVRLLAGELGEVATDGENFTAELRGAAAQLSAPPCPATSPECRANFGDRKCRVDLAGRTIRAQVVGASGSVLQLDAPVDDRFRFGRLRYLRGGNCGRTSVILAVEGEEIVLRDRPRMDVEQGATVEIQEGCDKRFATCRERFGNALNFRGEPHLPGTDLLTRYPGA